jgi:hypothetical protein
MKARKIQIKSAPLVEKPASPAQIEAHKAA